MHICQLNAVNLSSFAMDFFKIAIVKNTESVADATLSFGKYLEESLQLLKNMTNDYSAINGMQVEC